MPKSIQTQTAQDLLENAQVCLESLEGSLLCLYTSYDQCGPSDDKAKAMMSVCEVLANGALEDIEIATSKTKLDISAYIDLAHGITVMLDELSKFTLSEGHTAAAIYGLSLVVEQLKESLGIAVVAVMKGGSHNA